MPTASTGNPGDRELSQQLWDSSAASWLERVDEDQNRSVLLDPVMLALAGDPCRVLDVGCGEGRFCRMLSARGFDAVGIDPTSALIAKARELDLSGRYVEAFAESLPFEDGSFDLVVSYLTLLDIPDYRRAILEMSRVLAPGGRVLVANCTPYFTCLNYPWVKDENGVKLHVRVDQYVEEHTIRAQWCGIDILNYHRSYSDYFNAFLDCRMRLEVFQEVVPTAEMVAQSPMLADDLRVPNFMVMAWRKE
jgi:SAM-dependent methyltransferase